MSDDFSLDPRLLADTHHVGDLALCSVLLMDDARFPWLILVPRRTAASELTDLDEADAAALTGEIRLTVKVIQALAQPDKVNVAALGNVVAQLHVHVIARFRSDPAWPNPVWGHGERKPYPPHARAQILERAAQLFAAA
ncbi:HIT domain-containing protein [Methylorubrum salsuginis]|uniref:Diadenosine tetraphosphate (Ap4A) hydrolase n=1 Tax=Methylorubrum salsuginis TaxID=414703 RepID=A0A1I4ENI2_9HYPH|nr:HIT domain-containing protein [Methylorubrum salsuginis]SFL07308.1 Diadenosine tetraphosphate (Ap4A) hydrolase [Methylorubrum salsuginis]